MVKTYLLSALLIVMGIGAMAQERYADIKMVMKEPANGDSIYVNTQFNIGSTIYNLGPDTIRATDSMMYQLIFDGFPILFGSNMDSFLMFNGQEIVPGDSFDLSFGFSMDDQWTPGPFTFCTAMMPYNVTGNIYDTILNNNRSCNTVTIINTTGINKKTDANVSRLLVYPNPATTEAFIKLYTNTTAQMSYKLTDVTGRVLMQADKGMLPPGEHQFRIETGELSAGTYFYSVSIGGEVQNGRLSIR